MCKDDDDDSVDDDIIKNVKSVNEVKAKEFQQTFVTMSSHGKSVQMNTWLLSLDENELGCFPLLEDVGVILFYPKSRFVRSRPLLLLLLLK